MPDPLISLLVAALFGAAGLAIFWPDRGLYWRWERTRRSTERVLIEDALKLIHESEVDGQPVDPQGIAEALRLSGDHAKALLSKMEARGLLHRQEQGLRLTAEGQDYALYITRAHRVWERYLAEETGFAQDEWHEQAHRREHLLSPAEVDELSARLGHPTHDPHGDPIPTADGRMIPHDGRPLTTLETDRAARIVHLEDEPSTVYAQLVAEELHPGMELRVTQVSPQRVRFWADGDEHVLAPVVAANVMVTPLPELAVTPEPAPAQRLTALRPGEQACVTGISHAVRGTERRRLMDLGIVPGTLIEVAMRSPSGDPTAYRVRGTLIALRQEQADAVRISREEEVTG